MARNWLRSMGRGVVEEVIEVPIDQIVFNPYQPRKECSESGLEDLAKSIKEHGVLQPVILKRLGKGYELVAGERRVKASRKAGLKSIPAIVRCYDEREQALMALVENLQREDLNPLDEAEAYNRMLQEIAMTQEELARKVGKSQSTVANKLRLLKLPPEVRTALAKESLTERHARELLRLRTPEQQVEVLREIEARSLTVQETEVLVSGLVKRPVEQGGTHGRGRRLGIYRDLRIFMNSFRQVVTTLRKSGVGAVLEEEEDADFVYVRVRIPKNRGVEG
ncbi:MAG: ParB/RepB/Spo0J family partition protein [Bacillota bacterium]